LRRIVGLLLTGAAVFAAATLSPPAATPGPDFTGPEVRESVAAPTASVWYCPWVVSGALRDSSVMLAATAPVNAELTFPEQIAGEPADTGDVGLDAAGAVVVEVGDIVRRGDTPSFIEFDAGPAAAAAVVAGEGSLSGDACVARIPKVWELPGGTTREGRTLTLRLFNPFPELAKASVSGISESGETGLVDLQNLDVEGRQWVDVNLNELIPLLDDLALTVTTSEGFVIPAMILAGSSDEASWPGTSAATTWEFPVVTVSADYSPSLILTNSTGADVTATIDVYTGDGVVPDAREVEVISGIPRRVDLSDLAEGAMGIRVRATAPVAAVVLAEESPVFVQPTEEDGQAGGEAGGGDRLAGTIGTSAPATRWLLPGLQAVADANSEVWLLNTSDQSATVTLQPLGVESLTPFKEIVPPGSVLGVPLGYDVTVGGYFVESSVPISVGWSAEAETGLMFVVGTVVGE
jgi:hypothetical protein